MSETFQYQGTELELFQHATNWKAYFTKNIEPYIRGKVLEVGAGNGSTTAFLNKGRGVWTALEPDESLAGQFRERMKQLPPNTRILTETLAGIQENFDTIIYIDVLEHIEQDGEELKRAGDHLNPGGHLIVLSPAFQSLYSPFDKEIGHFRRYTKKTLSGAAPKGLKVERMVYLDTLGWMSSFANRFLLKQSYPSLKQISFWDKLLIPVSKIIDPLVGHSFGKTIIGVWTK